MAAEVSLPGLRDVAAAARAPDLAGLDAVCVGGGVAHLLERVAPVCEVPRPVGNQFQFERLDLGAVLFALEVAEFGRELVGGAVEAPGLGIEHVDVAPEQALAFVGELGSVDGDAVGEDAEGLRDGGDRVIAVPDIAGVELAALWGCAVECGALADRGGGGPVLELGGVDVRDEGHDDLPILSCTHRSVVRRCDVLFFHARASEPPGPKCLARGGARVVRARGPSGGWRGTSLAELGREPRSRAAPGLGAQRRIIPRPGRNGAQRSGGPRRRRGWRREHVWENRRSRRQAVSLHLHGLWTLLTKVETSCDRILIAGGANVEAEWEQGPAV